MVVMARVNEDRAARTAARRGERTEGSGREGKGKMAANHTRGEERKESQKEAESGSER